METRPTTGFTLWFTGMSGAGKSTLASYIAKRLLAVNRRVEVLDGDEVRENLSKGLGFSKDDRDTNIKRIGFVAKLLTRNDAIAISAAISPYREAREQVRRDVKRFVEVFVDCPLEKLIERDTKGLYKKALAGELKNFTGIDDPYEPPTHAEVMVRSDLESVEESATKIFQALVDLKYVSAAEFQKITGGMRPKRNVKPPARAARKGAHRKLAAKAAARKAPKKMAARTAKAGKARR
jgi:adenylylsulfate kinase